MRSMMVHPATASSLLLGAAALLLPAAPVLSQPQITFGAASTGAGSLITDIQSVPGDSTRLFVATREGRIKILTGFKNGAGSWLATDFLDITSKVYTGCSSGECGLLGLAFHPYGTGYFYVNYSRNAGGLPDTVIARYQVSSDANVADASSEAILEVIEQPYNNHNGGQMQFLPGTTFLYIGMGDGGSSRDPQDYAQRSGDGSGTILLGKMLRFDVGSNGNQWMAAGSASLPAASPAFDSKVWAYGLRNPWRFSFDRTTKDLYIADVGQNAREEINFTPANSTGGENYGWRECEGLIGHNGYATEAECNATGSTPVDNYHAPVFDYVRSDPNNGDPYGRSVTGGYVYRGSDYVMSGVYFYADYTGGWVRGALDTGSGSGWNPSYVSPNFDLSGVTTFGEDADGELYAGDSSGRVRRIVGPSPPTSSPTANPTSSPSKNPTSSPTAPAPTSSPVGPVPTTSPTTGSPTSSPTANPTSNPTANPSSSPSKTPSSSPTKSPIDLGVSCPSTLDQARILLDDMVLYYAIVKSPTAPQVGGLLCARIVLNREAWIGFGRQAPEGGMNGEVVIGHYLSGADVVKKYKITGNAQDPEEDLANDQTLLSGTISRANGQTTLAFTKYLIEGDLPWDLDGPNAIVFAAGATNNLDGGHLNDSRGSIVMDLTLCPSNACSGGQTCQVPTCQDDCGDCTIEADCTASGCTWTSGASLCPAGTRCSDCVDQNSCNLAGCNWRNGSCKGGSQAVAPGTCGGGPPQYTCPNNPPPPAVCGDLTCDVAAGEDECTCQSDCPGTCVTASPVTSPPTGSPTSSPTKNPTQGCVGVGNECTDKNDCCGNLKCRGSPKTCS